MNGLKDFQGKLLGNAHGLKAVKKALVGLLPKGHMDLTKDDIFGKACLPRGQRAFKAFAVRAAVPEELKHLDFVSAGRGNRLTKNAVINALVKALRPCGRAGTQRR